MKKDSVVSAVAASSLCFAAASLLCVTVAAAASPEQTVLARQHPLAVKWGEVTVRESGRVRVSPRGQELEYDRGLSLEFTGRGRAEDLDGLRAGRRQARSNLSPFGSVFLVANFDDRRGWDSFRSKLQAAVEQLGPAAYNQFLNRFSKQVMLAAGPPNIPYSVVYCLVTPGGGESAAEVSGRATRTAAGEQGWQNGSTGFGDSKPMCPALRGALENAPPVQVITTDFQVEQAVAEELQLSVADRTSAPASPWPPTARIKRAPAPQGATAYERARRDGDAAEHEELRQPRKGDPAGEAPYVLTADAAPASFAYEYLDGRSVIMRWSWTARGEQLGADPRSLFEDAGEMLYGVFPASDASRVDVDGFRDAVAQRLERTDGLLNTAAVGQALVDSNAALGLDDALAVMCYPDARNEQKAEYCVLKACSQVTNPIETCDALRRHLAY